MANGVDSLVMVGRRFTVFGVAAVALVAGAQFLLRSCLPPNERASAVDFAPEPPPAAPGSEGKTAVAAALAPAAPAAREPRAGVARKFERRFMYDCNGDRFFVRIGDEEARLLPPGSLTGYYIPLARVGSAWRGRYANESVVFRQEGEVASFELGEHTFTGCVGVPDSAAVNEATGGVFFQAFGNDPSWTFEITHRELTLTTDDGMHRVEIPFREPIDSGGRITFHAALGTQEMVATLDRIRCYDAASRETFELTAAVMFDNAWYYGCGRLIRYR